MNAVGEPASRSPAPKSFVLLIALAAVWGSSFMIIKIGVATMPALSFTALRMAIAAVAGLVILLCAGAHLPRTRRVWGLCFLIALFGNSVPFFLIGWGEERIHSGTAAILMAVMPLATLVLAHYFADGERMTAGKGAGVAIGFAGIVVLVGPEALRGLGGDLARQLAVAGGALCYALTVIITRNMPPGDLVGRMAAMMLMAALQLIPVALWLEPAALLSPTATALWSSAYLAILGTALSTVLFFHLIQKEGASFVAFINYLIPVVGVLAGAVVLGEAITAQAVAALAMILVGIAAANWRSRA